MAEPARQTAYNPRTAPVPDRRNAGANGSGNRSVEQLKSDIARMQGDLAVTVDEIAQRVAPQTVKEKAKSKAQQTAERVKAAAKAQVIDPRTGEVRKERVGAAGGAVLLLATIRATTEIVRHRRRSRSQPARSRAQAQPPRPRPAPQTQPTRSQPPRSQRRKRRR